MPTFIILRTQTEETGNPTFPSEVSIKFFPLKWPGKSRGQFDPATVEKETPEAALAWAVQRFPYLRTFLAVQEKSSYDATVAILLAARVPRPFKSNAKRVHGAIEA